MSPPVARSKDRAARSASRRVVARLTSAAELLRRASVTASDELAPA
jgi:hypothetical protein